MTRPLLQFYQSILATVALLAWPSFAFGQVEVDPEPRVLERIGVASNGADFIKASSGERFVAWGVNYDHDRNGRLLEDYWIDEWETVVEDFAEMKALGANVVRVHLQLGRFMRGPDEPNTEALAQLRRLVELAERTGIYLDLTGLGCYHKDETPAWYTDLGESGRWRVQARFWESVAAVGAESPAIFCYDLMNEPILPGADKVESDWLAGAFGGKYFVQRIALDLDGRSREEVARAWVDQLVDAIRRHDDDALITVGVIPWAHTFPGAEPLFYSPLVGERLDFVSVHFYPKRGEVDQALEALSVYDLGKPIVVEEMFPLHCSVEELLQFVASSRPVADGWISFYWGETTNELESKAAATIGDLMLLNWLRAFSEFTP
ncbi:MAG: cellulase family glycosylhydrolase [Phycisphaerales bacterium]